MTARNKLVIVRDADEYLQIPVSKRLKVHMTQTMSDQVRFPEGRNKLYQDGSKFSKVVADVRLR